MNLPIKGKIAIGFIAYGESTAKYLPFFLESLEKQLFRDFFVLAVDNTENENNPNSAFIEKEYPEINPIRPGKNIGFGRANNLMIREAKKRGARYFFAVNPDTVSEPETLGELLTTMKNNPAAGAVQPKILKLDFNPPRIEKTGIVDSRGLMADRKLRFWDDCQGQKDSAGDKNEKEVFGFTGAAVLMRIAALDDVAAENAEGEKEFFDELMFMYKEDCDLSLRLRLAGWKIVLAPRSIVYHDRSAAQLGGGIRQIVRNRKNKKRLVKEWSFLNQRIVALKFSRLFPLGMRFKIWLYQLGTLIFAAFFESYLLKQLVVLRRNSILIKSKREKIKIRTDLKEFMKEFRK